MGENESRPKHTISRRKFIKGAVILTGSAVAVNAGYQARRSRLIANEFEENKTITSNEALIDSISSTAQAVDGKWDYLIDKEKFPRLAVYSLVKSRLLNLDGGGSGCSANIMFHKRKGENFWIKFTAGHVLKRYDELESKNSALKLSMIRDNGLPNPGKIDFDLCEFGRAGIFDEYLNKDIGVYVFRDSQTNQRFNSMFGANDTLYWKDLYFGDISSNANFNGAYYFMDSKPTATINGKFNLIEIKKNGRSFVIDNSKAWIGSSGGGMFLKKGKKDVYVGPLISGYDIDKSPSSIYADNTTFYPISDIGEAGLNDLIDQAITDLDRRSGK